MTLDLLLFGAGAAIAGVVLGFVLAAVVGARSWRIVLCPHTRRLELVRCDAKRAALTMVRGGRQRVVDCSRWRDCARCKDRQCELQLS